MVAIGRGSRSARWMEKEDNLQYHPYSETVADVEHSDKLEMHIGWAASQQLEDKCVPSPSRILLNTNIQWASIQGSAKQVGSVGIGPKAQVDFVVKKVLLLGKITAP